MLRGAYSQDRRIPSSVERQTTKVIRATARYPDPAEMRGEMLAKWVATSGPQATYRQLAELDEGDAAEKVRRLVEKPSETPLNLSLEELYQGCEKKVLSPDGTTRQKEKVITISVKPGWETGTKITFPQEGDQVAGKIPQDIVFVVKEKPHSDYTREGNDLYYTAKISLKDALVGTTLSIPMID